jgi:hypothetical protein
MDIESLMASAKGIQDKISVAQDSLAQKRVKGIAENGAVIVDMTGKYDVISVTINPDILSRGANVVGDLVADAYRDAKEKADILIDKIMTDVTGGFSLN